MLFWGECIAIANKLAISFDLDRPVANDLIGSHCAPVFSQFLSTFLAHISIISEFQREYECFFAAVVAVPGELHSLG